MKNNCRLPRNRAVIVALVAGAVFFVSCDTMDWPSYTVAFSANGGTGTVPSQTVDARSSITIPGGGGLSKTGYVFVGWNTNSAGTGTDFNVGGAFTPTGNTTLFARWAVAFTVTFDANGGSGTSPAPQTVAVGFAITLPGSDGLSRDEHSFLGWNKNAYGTGANFNAGDIFTPTSNITLYARWEMGRHVPGATLADQLAWLRTHSQSGSSYIVELSDNATLIYGAALPTSRANLVITLRGVGSVRTITRSTNGMLFSIGTGVTLVLDKNVTLQGMVGNNNHLVRVNSGGILVMNAGSRVTGNTNAENRSWFSESFGGGVRVNSGGTFAMRGGEISNNSTAGSSTGGGVHVASGGTFRMSDGVIHGSDAELGLRNTATGIYSSAALFGTAQHGTFNAAGVFTSLGNLFFTDNTIRLANGLGQPTGVTVSPSTASVAVGGSREFAATVVGFAAPQGVTWSIVETGAHAQTVIDANGVLTIADNESLSTITVRATSTVDTSLSGTATVTVFVPSISEVTVSPSTASVARGGMQDFTAEVSGTNEPQQTVTWSIIETGAHAQTVIDANGVLTIADNESLSTITVRATSTVDTSVSGTATVNVLQADQDGNAIVPGTDFANRLDWVRNNAQSDGRYLIEISGNEVLGPQTLPAGRTNLTITLRGIGDMRTVSLLTGTANNGSLFAVGSGVTLVIDNNITLQGRTGNNRALVVVNSGGTLVMNTGSRVIGNTNPLPGDTEGGGVSVNSGGTFHLRGGEIAGNNGCCGGGVHNRGTFLMSDGVVHGSGASAELRNTATGSGGGAALFNAGIAQRGTFSNGSFASLGTLNTTNGTIRLANGLGQPTGVTVSPSTASVSIGGSMEFSATVLGTNNPPQTVTWLIVETGVHAQTVISANGALTIADDESLSTITVRATSTVDTSVSGTATVTMLIPVVTGVTVSPSTVSVARGRTQDFTAEVLGTNDPPQTITWSIVETGVHEQTVIGANGALTIADNESLSTITVRATSTFDTSVSGTATVNVLQTDQDGNVIVPGTNLANRLDWVRDNAQDGGRYLIEISGHEILGPHVLPTGRNLTITLRGIGAMRTVNLTASGSIFAVGSGVTLVLCYNVTLEGRNSAAHGFNNNNHLIRVNDGGTLVMNAGSRLTGNNNTIPPSAWQNNNEAFYGGGVRVNSGGVFYMHGGEISGNSTTGNSTSGGVDVRAGGMFYMHGGEISGNNASGSSTSGGVRNAGTFRMSGGVIYGNELEVPAGLRNTAPNGWAALFNAGIAQRGTFSVVGGFVSEGLLSSTNNTIEF